MKIVILGSGTGTKIETEMWKKAALVHGDTVEPDLPIEDMIPDPDLVIFAPGRDVDIVTPLDYLFNYLEVRNVLLVCAPEQEVFTSRCWKGYRANGFEFNESGWYQHVIHFQRTDQAEVSLEYANLPSYPPGELDLLIQEIYTESLRALNLN